MFATQITRLIAFLAICDSSPGVAQTDSIATDPEEIVEEIVVTAVNECGTWPIQHRRLIGCEYVELENVDLKTVLDLRPKLFASCLTCEGSQCIPNVLPEHNPAERLICRRVFWTPTRVARFMTSSGASGALTVSFTFTISATGSGRVKDIEVISFEGEILEEKLLELIESGARKTEFEPLIVDDLAYEIVGLKDSYLLGDS